MNQTENGSIATISPPMAPSSKSTAALDDPRVIQAVREYQAKLDAGQPPDRQAFLARHPDIADALRGCVLVQPNLEKPPRRVNG